MLISASSSEPPEPVLYPKIPPPEPFLYPVVPASEPNLPRDEFPLPGDALGSRYPASEGSTWQQLNAPKSTRAAWEGGMLPAGHVIGSKYRVLRVLGQGGSSVTYEAEELGGIGTVAVKALSLKGLRAWKDMDLFEREAKTLQGLKHPGIPEYVDYIEEDTSSNLQLFLVQKMAPGRSLGQLIADGQRFEEGQVISIMLQVLDILQYLEGLSPPVVHRDIKPENIVFSPETGLVQIVDFGGVQKMAAFSGGSGSQPLGSTVVGTYGFMAPEQFQNRASTQSDLYALGATALFLLSGGAPPSSFPQTRLKIDFRSSLPGVSRGLAVVIEGLLEPAQEDRYWRAADVKSSLLRVQQGQAAGVPKAQQGWGSWDGGWQGEWGPQQQQGEQLALGGQLWGQRNSGGQYNAGTWQQQQDGKPRQGELGAPWEYPRSGDALVPSRSAADSGAGVWTGIPESDRPPAGTRVLLEETPGSLRIEIPPVGLTGTTIGTGSFALAWNAFVAFWTASAATAGAGLLFTAFSIPFWVVGAGLAKAAASSIAVSVHVELTGRLFRIQWKVGDLWSHSAEGRVEDIFTVDAVTVQTQNERAVMACEIKEGVKSHQFGSGLEPVELRWLARRIGRYLARTLGTSEESYSSRSRNFRNF